MSKTFGLVAAAALLASVTAFAQDNTAAPAAAPAASDSASAPSEGKPMKHHHHHVRERARDQTASTDYDADKLNSCQVDARPTTQQENCLTRAENKGG